MELIFSTTYLLQHIAAMMMRQSDQMLQERLGIGMSQFKILSLLEEEPNIQQRKLADHLGQTEASVSRQIKLMREKGFLMVGVNPKSKREHITILTPKGIKMAAAAQEALNQYSTPFSQVISEKQLSQLADTLAVIHEHVCGSGKSFGCDHSHKM